MRVLDRTENVRGRWYDKRCVGAGVFDGPHDRCVMSFSVPVSGSGAGAETILLAARKRKFYVNVW